MRNPFLGLKLVIWDFLGVRKFSGGLILARKILAQLLLGLIKNERTSGFSILC